MWSGGAPQQYGGGGSSSNQKNDIFVGNLAFNTTEEQLHQAFSEIGKVVNVRLVTDVETGKPRGFAFVEFQEAQAALSAIRNMNDYELNKRRLRVNFSNSSHLEALAGKLGMDVSSNQRPNQQQSSTSNVSAGTNAVADSLKAMSKAEMYDVVAKLKEMADRDPDEARRLLSGHPQLPEALLFLMSKLDMVKTPIATEVSATAAAPVVPAPPAPRDPRAADPRTTTAPPPPTRVDPRAAAAAAAAAAVPAAPNRAPTAPTRVDPRQRADPRARAATAAPSYPPPPPPPPPRAPIDPALVQQVMSLTPQQIQQLPPDKQQSILQLRQQITGGR